MQLSLVVQLMVENNCFSCRSSVVYSIALIVFSLCTTSSSLAAETVELGSRPSELVSDLPAGPLRSMLESCSADSATTSAFSIAHRGAPLRYPEHTLEGYIAAAKMGAGIIECDVTFTGDRSLVCRHSQCDLHTTTNILKTPLAEKCSVSPDYNSGTPFKDVRCCTSDITLAEFKTLKGKFDSGNKKASTLSEYMSLDGTRQADIKNTSGTLMTHKESIQLFKKLGVQMVPELKAPQVAMPFQGDFSQHDYAQAMVNEYVNEQVSPSDVFMQSFNLDDVHYWLKNTPEFGQQAVWLDGRYRDRSFDANKEKSWEPTMQELAESGVNIVAPPMWMLLTLDGDRQVVPSAYANAAAAAGLDIVAWTLERSGSLEKGGGWYYQSVKKAIERESDVFKVLHVLAQDVKVRGVFSDWAATTTYYANCAGLE